MIIDCDSCAVRYSACADCVVGVLLDASGPREGSDDERWMPSGASTVTLDAPERRALDVLAEQGLVPRLRLVATRPRRTTAAGHGEADRRDAG